VRDPFPPWLPPLFPPVKNRSGKQGGFRFSPPPSPFPPSRSALHSISASFFFKCKDTLFFSLPSPLSSPFSQAESHAIVFLLPSHRLPIGDVFFPPLLPPFFVRKCNAFFFSFPFLPSLSVLYEPLEMAPFPFLHPSHFNKDRSRLFFSPFLSSPFCAMFCVCVPPPLVPVQS